MKAKFLVLAMIAVSSGPLVMDAAAMQFPFPNIPGVTTPAPVAPQPGNDLMAELGKFSLTMDHIRKLGQVYKTLQKQAEAGSHPFMPDFSKLYAGNESADFARAVESTYPGLAATLKAGGLSTKDFFLIQYTLTFAQTAVSLKKAGMQQAVMMPGMPVRAENVAFVEKHFDEILALLAQPLGN
jgi:hypothetical protein